MEQLKCNGWSIYFHPLFESQLKDLISEVKALSKKLEREEFLKRFEAKMLKALRNGIKEVIPSDPFAPRFRFNSKLSKYGRLKDWGIPERYRLFFRAESRSKSIIILWLGYPREKGSKNDCYKVFEQMVEKEKFPADIEELIEICNSTILGF